MPNLKELERIAVKIRLGALEAVYSAQSGHPGGSLSIADTLAYLYFSEMKIDPANPKMEDRDRLVLSKGHTAPGLYAALALRGFFPPEELGSFRGIKSMLQGHPDMKGTPGVDMSTGSLGQGVSAACGMAKAAKLCGKDYRVFAIVGDGELQEGQIWEAAMFAGHHKLDNLVVIVDNNGLQIDGRVDEICSPQPITDKFASFGFDVFTADAHDFVQLDKAFTNARQSKGRPIAIVQKSIKGKGVSFMQDNCAWHGAAPSKEQYEQAVNELEELLCQI